MIFRLKFALRALCSRRMWHWRGFYYPRFGWFRFGAGCWLKYLFTFRWAIEGRKKGQNK